MANSTQSDQANRKSGPRALIAIGAFAALLALIWFTSGDNFYLWLKSFHIIAVISWMAGLLYLPRLFINHCDKIKGSEADLMLAGMEQRLMKIIMTPAMILSWIFGIWLASLAQFWAEPWFLIKFLAIVLMTVTHFYFAKAVKRFASDENKITTRSWRMINEIPTVLMFLAIIMVIVKPFS